MNKPNIHNVINHRMAGLIVYYTITGHPKLRKLIPKHLRGKSRYNTCYDLERPRMPLEQVNEYINTKSDKVKTYLRTNMPTHEYLRVDMFATPLGMRATHSLIKELPSNYKDMERTGVVRFVETSEVRLK